MKCDEKRDYHENTCLRVCASARQAKVRKHEKEIVFFAFFAA